MAEKEYIEREAFKAEVRRLSTHYLNEWDTLGVLAAADRIPAADVRPVVRASWEEKEKDGVWWYACSVCGEHIPKGRWGQEWHSNFCPNCGASMSDGEDNNVLTKESEEVSAVRCWLTNGADMRDKEV